MSVAYNICMKNWSDGGFETAVFSRPIIGRELSHGKKMLKPLRDKYEKVPMGCVGGSMEYNPFTGEYEWMWEMSANYEEIVMSKKVSSKRASLSRSKKEFEAIALGNDWTSGVFGTLTFNDKIVDARDYGAISDTWSKFEKEMSRLYPEAEFLACPEMHPTSGRWHIHFLARGAKFRLIDSGHKTKNDHNPIYNMPLDWPYGFTTVTFIRSASRASRYICKYMGKELASVPFGKRRFWASKSLKRLEDISETFLFSAAETEKVVVYLESIADSVRRVFVESARMWVTFFKVYAPVDDFAVAPT